MPFRYHARRVLLASALGLTLTATLAACSSSASSSSTPAPGSSAVSATSAAAASSPASSSAAASSSASSPATSGGGSATAIADIKANWVKFFSSSTPDSERVALLQNGPTFAAAIKSFASSPLASAVSSKVDSVALTSATQAAVKYEITAAGTAVPGGSGTAVRQDGTWKVGDDVFCGLLKEGAPLLGITVPAACK